MSSFCFSLRLRFGNKAPSKMLSSHLKASNFGLILLSKGTPWWCGLQTLPCALHDMLFWWSFCLYGWKWKSKSLDFSNASCYVASESFRPSVWYVWGYTKGASNTLFYWWGGINRHLLVPSVQMLRLRMEEVGAPKFVAKHWSKKGPLTNPRYYWLLVVGYWFLGCWLLVVVGWLLSHIFQFNKCRPERFYFLNSRYAVGYANLLSRLVSSWKLDLKIKIVPFAWFFHGLRRILGVRNIPCCPHKDGMSPKTHLFLAFKKGYNEPHLLSSLVCGLDFIIVLTELLVRFDQFQLICPLPKPEQNQGLDLRIHGSKRSLKLGQSVTLPKSNSKSHWK